MENYIEQNKNYNLLKVLKFKNRKKFLRFFFNSIKNNYLINFYRASAYIGHTRQFLRF